MSERIPAVHPSEFIVEELEARLWTRDDLAKHMGGDFGIDRLALDFYLDLGPDDFGIRLGDSAERISRAFDCDPTLFKNLERAWLEHPSNAERRAALIASHQDREKA